MAVANTLSTIVTNADAGDNSSLNPALSAHAHLREQVASVETAAADDAGSVYRLFRVHSSWRVSSVEIGHDAVTNMTTADIGVHEIADDGGAVVDVDEFASGIDMSSASAGLVDRTYEAAATDIAKIAMPLWERLGLAVDPNQWYDITVTATTNDPTAAVTIAGRARFADRSR